MITMTKSQMALLLASIVTLYFTWAALQSDNAADIAMPTRTLAENRLPVKPGALPEFSLQTSTQQRAAVPLISDLFSAPSVEIAIAEYKKSAPIVKVAPQPIIAPPLPFKYVGRWQDDEKNSVMIDYRGDMIEIKVGDIVANQYKVMAINEAGSSLQIQFLMMSLNQIQTMQARAGQP